MTNGVPATTRRRPLAVRVVLEMIERIWAVVLIAIVLYLSYRAFRYLVLALLVPGGPPPQIVDVPLRMTGYLRAAGTEYAGVAAEENPRTPLEHYHRLGIFAQADRLNSCTQSGCHAPLPHARNKADRAFLNMHATSMHCGVCHMKGEHKPLRLVWYDLQTGGAHDPPAMLRAFGWLEENRTRTPDEFTAADQQTIVELMRSAAQAGGASPVLVSLVQHLTAVRHDSEEFVHMLDVAHRVVPLHFRGEYGAKIALADGAGQPRLVHPGSQDAVREFLLRKNSLTGAERDAVLAKVHPARRDPTLHCLECHRGEGGLVDWTKVGYPLRRVQQLTQPLIRQAIEHMLEGRDFYMPGFTPGVTTRPATQPATR